MVLALSPMPLDAENATVTGYMQGTNKKHNLHLMLLLRLQMMYEPYYVCLSTSF